MSQTENKVQTGAYPKEKTLLSKEVSQRQMESVLASIANAEVNHIHIHGYKQYVEAEKGYRVTIESSYVTTNK